MWYWDYAEKRNKEGGRNVIVLLTAREGSEPAGRITNLTSRPRSKGPKGPGEGMADVRSLV